MNVIFNWVVHHGYLGIYALLAVGVIAVPVPEDAVLIVAGSLVARGKWSLVPTWGAAWAGCMTGITISYLLGRFVGQVVLNRFGDHIGVTAARRDQAMDWFHRVGKWGLLLSYFIPGIRHLAAITAGASHLRFLVFAAFAWSGAFVWSTTFLSLGYLVGENWQRAERHLRQPQLMLLVAISAIVIAAIWLHRHRSQTLRSSRAQPGSSIDNRLATTITERASERYH